MDDMATADRPARAALAPALPPCLVADVALEHFAECGLAAWEADQADEALTWFRAAMRLSAALAEADPRRISALASLAAVEAATHARGDAAMMLGEAVAAWDAAQAWVSAMTPEHKPRSSLYHHRLERKHAGAYAEIARHGCRRLLDAGRAACMNNLALCLASAGAQGDAEAMLREAADLRERALGARDIGVMRILASLADLLDARGDLAEAAAARARARAILARRPISTLERWRRHRTGRMTDSRRLEAAVLLVPVLQKLPRG
jgi:hypothetical protein